jgi:hypothetical protein
MRYPPGRNRNRNLAAKVAKVCQYDEHSRFHPTSSVLRAFDRSTILVRNAHALSFADFVGLLVYRQSTLKRPNHGSSRQGLTPPSLSIEHE